MAQVEWKDVRRLLGSAVLCCAEIQARCQVS